MAMMATYTAALTRPSVTPKAMGGLARQSGWVGYYSCNSDRRNKLVTFGLLLQIQGALQTASFIDFAAVMEDIISNGSMFGGVSRQTH
jgi:hypothetical protein